MKRKEKTYPYQRIEKEKINRMASWINMAEVGPIRLHLNLTDRCNLTCKFCWQRTNDKIPKDKELSKDRIFELLEEAKKIGVMEVFISGGGEPLMKEEIWEIMLKIKKLGFWADMTTNGTLFDKEFIEKLVKAKWNHINFSLDGDEKTHDFLRQKKGVFRKAVENIKYFNYCKKKFKSDFPELSIAMVLNRKNYALLPYMFELASGLNCSDIQVNAIKSYTNPKLKTRVSYFFDDLLGRSLYLKKNDFSKLEKIIKLINSGRDSKYNLDLNLIKSFENYNFEDYKESQIPTMLKENRFNYSDKKYVCFEPFLTIVANPDGSFGCCCERAGEYKKMNLKNNSLSEIWKSDYYNKVRKSISDGRLSQHCAKCGLWQIDNTNIIKNLLKKNKRMLNLLK